MKVENASVDQTATSFYTREVKPASKEQQSASVVPPNMPDQISLSGASDLIVMTKQLIPADRLSNFQAISAMVRAGKYQPDASATSQALIEAHTES